MQYQKPYQNSEYWRYIFKKIDTPASKNDMQTHTAHLLDDLMGKSEAVTEEVSIINKNKLCFTCCSAL